MVDPDVGRALNVDEIHALGGVVHGEVADDDVGNVLHAEATVSETSGGTDTNDGGVALNLHDVAASELAINLDNTALGDGRGELRARGDSNTLA